MKTFYGFALSIATGYFSYALALRETLGDGLSAPMRVVYVAAVFGWPMLLVLSGINAVRPLPGFGRLIGVLAFVLACAVAGFALGA